MQIFTVAIDAHGQIVKIALNLLDVLKWVNEVGRVDLVVMSFCSMSEYYQYLVDNDYKAAIKETE